MSEQWPSERCVATPHLLLSSSLLGMVTSLVVGFLVARRVARPIYELQLQVASAAQRIRIEVPPGRAGFEALGDHMAAILRKIEATDAAIAEQRQPAHPERKNVGDR
jgi:nitrogen fixation/metabolism regulation signal transduction histidine kinase